MSAQHTFFPSAVISECTRLHFTSWVCRPEVRKYSEFVCWNYILRMSQGNFLRIKTERFLSISNPDRAISLTVLTDSTTETAKARDNWGSTKNANYTFKQQNNPLCPQIMVALKVEETGNAIHCWRNVCHVRCAKTVWKLLIISWKALFLASFLLFPPLESQCLS